MPNSDPSDTKYADAKYYRIKQTHQLGGQILKPSFPPTAINIIEMLRLGIASEITEEASHVAPFRTGHFLIGSKGTKFICGDWEK